MSEDLQIVDRQDVPIGTATRQEAWAKGQWLRMVRIILHDGRGRVLLQRRDPHAPSYPDCWTDAATGHVNADEDYIDAAHRELKEELGVDVELTLVGKFALNEKVNTSRKRSFNAVFVGMVAHHSEFSLERGSVSDVRWCSLEELRREVADDSTQLTPGLLKTASDFLRQDSVPTHLEAVSIDAASWKAR